MVEEVKKIISKRIQVYYQYKNNTGHTKTGIACLVSVIRPRLERGTVCLEGRCSIQLSYRTIFRNPYCGIPAAKLRKKNVTRAVISKILESFLIFSILKCQKTSRVIR